MTNKSTAREEFEEEVRAALEARIQDHHKEGFILTALNTFIESIAVEVEENERKVIHDNDWHQNSGLQKAAQIIRSHKST